MWKYVKVVFKCLPAIIYAYFSWMLKFSKHPEKYDIKLRFAKIQGLVRKILRAFNVSLSEIDLNGFNDYPTNAKNRFIVCNHLSDADPLIFLALSSRPITFVAKKETLKFPLVGRAIKILNGEFIDRNDLKMQLRVFKNVENKMKEIPDLDWIIFPEGTRNKVNVKEVQEFHYGSFKPAMRNELPIYVFSLLGTQRILDKKCKNKTYIIPLKLNKFISPDEYKNKSTVEISELSYSLCNEGVKSLIKIDENFVKKFSKKN